MMAVFLSSRATIDYNLMQYIHLRGIGIVDVQICLQHIFSLVGFRCPCF